MDPTLHLSIASLTHATRQVSEAAKRALADLRKSRPDMDEANLKVDIPVARPVAAPHQVAPHQAALGLHGGAALPAYMGARALGLGGPGAGIRTRNIAAAMGVVPGMGMGMGGGMDGGMGGGMGGAGMGAPRMGLGVGFGNNNPFMFGAGQPHQFVAPAFGAPRPLGLDPPAWQAREAAIPEAAVHLAPLAQAGGIWVPPAQVRGPPGAPAQPVMAAGHEGRRRKGR